MLRVRDIMTKDVTAVAPDRPVSFAKWKMKAERISGMPVRNPTGEVVGVLSKTDLTNPILQEDGATVADVMCRAAWSVSPHDDALLAVELMLEHEIHRVLVIEHGRLCGIVTTTDILRAIAGGGDFGATMVNDAPTLRIVRSAP